MIFHKLNLPFRFVRRVLQLPAFHRGLLLTFLWLNPFLSTKFHNDLQSFCIHFRQIDYIQPFNHRNVNFLRFRL